MPNVKMLGESAPPLLIGAAIALTSGGVFVSQLLLSTFLDILFFHDFRFVLVSLALFGLGAGGVSFALLLRRNVLSKQRLTIVCGALYAGTALAPFAVPQLLHHASLLQVELLVIVVTCFANYLSAGALIASLLTFRPKQVPLLYAIDLFGATSMGIIAIYIADTFGFFASVRFLFFIAFASFVCIWMRFGTYAHRALIAVAVALLAAGVLLVVPLEINCGTFQVQRIYDRGGIPNADTGKLVGQATNSFSHVSLYLYELQSNDTLSSIRILINCAVPTQGIKANQLSDGSDRISSAELRSWPFVFNPPQSSLIIGSGAGVDVARALAVGGEKVTAVDINPLTFQLVRRHRPDLSLPFGDPRVTTIVGDGRSYAAASAEKYDLIFLAAVKNFHQPWGLQSFTSHNLYTVEAFTTYKDRLTPGGMLVIYDWQWYTRPHLVTLQELLRRESESLDERVMVFTEKTTPREIIFYKNGSFSDAERRAAGSGTSNREFIFNETPLSILLSDIPRSITTDDKPFLQSTKPLLQSSHFRELPYGTFLNEQLTFRDVWSWVIAGSILAMGLLLWLFRSTELTGWRAVKPAYFFIGISFGLAALEFVMINKATLLLGNPVYAYAIAIAAVLSSGALGSIIAYRFDLGKYLRECSASMALLLLTYYVFLPAIAASMVFSFGFKVFVIFIAASIPGVLAGMIFPIAFQKACQHRETYSLWMWGIDAFAFVVAYFVISAAVVQFGVGAILLLGAMGYAVATVTSRSLDD